MDWEEYQAEGDDYIPMDRWGKDHWSTFAYLETLTVDHRGVIENSRMRCNARLHRELVAMPFMDHDGAKYPTILKDGEIDRHDDWSCLEDMVSAGLIRAFYRVARHGVVFGGNEAKVELTPLGQKVAAELRVHKAGGGAFGSFNPSN